MPKIVDQEERRRELAAALWRLLVRDGTGAATLRRVAAEAGWSVGSLRHYFDSQAALLAYSMELVIDRVTERVNALGPDADPAALLEETLPLDEERRAETQVWTAFTAAALTDPSLRALRDESHRRLRSLCVLAAGGDERAGERLHATLDGLALHALLDPEVTDAARQRELLRDALAAAASDR